MRIAIMAPLVTPIREPQLGGSQAVVADLSRGLTERGHEVDVYAAAGSSIPRVRVVDTGIDAGSLQDVLYRPDRPWLAAGHAAETAFRTVVAAIGRLPYDVVHNHAFDPPAVRCAAGLSSPVIHTLHLPPDPAMAVALADASRSGNPPTVATVSESSAAAWRQLTRIDLVLRNGVPVDRIPWSAGSGGQLLFAGRFSAEKGAADAIEIARRAETEIQLYGEPYDPDYMQAEVEPHRGEPGVTIRGGVPRHKLWMAMAQAAAVLCPVKWEEPYGLVAAEAQAAGTAVIAYRRGALSDVVQDRKTGFLVPPDDVIAAAKAVAQVKAISRSDCRKHAEVHLNLDTTLTAHERLYKQVQDSAGLRRHG